MNDNAPTPAATDETCPTCRHRITGHLLARGCMECDCELDPDEISRPWDAPAATDETATKIATSAIQSLSRYDGRNSAEIAAAVVAALEANGYVVLPRKELDDLLAAVTFAHVHQNRPAWALLLTAHEAVVEAVGPTREEP